MMDPNEGPKRGLSGAYMGRDGRNVFNKDWGVPKEGPKRGLKGPNRGLMHGYKWGNGGLGRGIKGLSRGPNVWFGVWYGST